MNKVQLYPNDLFQKLEFDKVLELLIENCLGELGQEAVKNQPIFTEVNTIKTALKEVNEYRISIDERHQFPLRNYEDLAEDLKMLDIPGFVLAIEGLQRINIVLLQIADIFKFFERTTYRENYPTLHEIIKGVRFDKELQQEIVRVIDEEGEIRADASPELQRIRKRMIGKRKESDKKFRTIITNYQSKGLLTDNLEAYRNGRRVLSVPVENKRKIKGIIHDESATGKTVFIEPEAIIEINNEIFNLESEENREIYRILRALSDILRPYTFVMRTYQEVLIRYDVIQSKAVLARQMKAAMPQIVDKPNINWQTAFHPLLLLKNKKVGQKTIPFTLTFHRDNRILVLSGPNAGGKSISMKSVGLLQLMVQAGMLVPAEVTSEVGVFEQFFADIGDQQSIEDDLSTYSSRLRNAKMFVENATDKTLVLIDEFGSGTDPKMGGAIAEAILQDLHKRKVFGVITTHYSNLKVFAFKTKGIINGSMRFNRETLSPTYEMKVGRPGSSYAFEIAEKSGLPNRVLKYARHKTGKNTQAVEDLLVDLQREKKEVEEELNALKIKQEQLNRLVKAYEELQRDVEFSRKRIKLEARQKALQETAQSSKDLERLVKEIREKQNLEKALAEAKELVQENREKREEIAETVTELVEEIYYKPEKPYIPQPKTVKKGAIEVGDFVKLKTGGSTGRVEAINRKNVIVAMGLLKVTVKLRDLQHAAEPLEIQKEKNVKTDILSTGATFNSKIDIRGMRYQEALTMVQDFVDEAIIANVNNLKIVHGKGNGTLRKAVKSKLREYKEVNSIRHERDEAGGNGVTLVDLL